MNAISKTNCCGNYNKPIQGNVILRSNNSTLGPISYNLTTDCPRKIINQPIASVNIDTTYMDELKIFINFSGILTTIQDGFDITTFNFTLYKYYIGSMYRQQIATFSTNFNVGSSDLPASTALNFDYYSCDYESKGYCTYTLELTYVASNDPDTASTVTISGNLSVLAIDYSFKEFLPGMNCRDIHTAPKLSDVILKSNNIYYGPNSFNFDNNTLSKNINKPLASITVDNTCMYDPTLLLDFSCILTQIVDNINISFTFDFILFKISGTSIVQQPIAAFSYSQETDICNSPISNTINHKFSVCEDCYESHYTYILVLEKVTLNNPICQSLVNTTVSIMGTLSGFIVGSPNWESIPSCCRNKYVPTKSLLLNSSSVNFSPLIYGLNRIHIINQTVGSATLDITCMEEPKLLIKFSGILTQSLNSVDVLTFNFTLFKNSKDSMQRIPVTRFTFNFHVGVEDIPISTALLFEYSYCEDILKECVIYSLDLINVVSERYDTMIHNTTINGNMSVLAVNNS